jgi:hypothetical protein
VTIFGEYQDVKRKGRTPIAAKSKTESPKKKITKVTHEDEDVEESEESDAINDEEDYQKDKERDRKKVKLEKSAMKDYLGEYSLKNSPEKFGKPHYQIKAARQVLQSNNNSTPMTAGPEETKKKTVENKLGNVEKLDFSDKKMADMKDKITKTVTNNLKDILTQFFEKQQPKQEITNKEDIKEKHDDKDV